MCLSCDISKLIKPKKLIDCSMQFYCSVHKFATCVFVEKQSTKPIPIIGMVLKNKNEGNVAINNSCLSSLDRGLY